MPFLYCLCSVVQPQGCKEVYVRYVEDKVDAISHFLLGGEYLL